MTSLASPEVLRASFLDDPYPLYRQLRDEQPVSYHESVYGPIWILARYDDVVAALTDWRTFSSVPGPTRRTSHFEMRRPVDGRPLIETDPPFHDALRETVQARFSPRRIRELETSFRDVAIGLLDEIRSAARFDVARDYAWPLTLHITSDIIGIPESDRTTVLAWYLDIIYSHAHDTAAGSAKDYHAYFSQFAAERLKRPRDDLMSEMMQLTTQGRLTVADAVLLCIDLFEGGVDVPANLIGGSVLALADRPEQRAFLADPDIDASALRIAIEELARFDAPIQHLPRATTTDVSLRGVTIPAGSRVRILLGSANRDERRYEEPDRLDLSRPPVRGVAFGVGVHFCIGAPLARLGVGVALPTLLRELSSFTVVPPVERPRGADNMRALLTLKVERGGSGSAEQRASGAGLRIVVDMDRCDSHGQCALAAPTVFALDDDLNLHYNPEPPHQLAPDVERAAMLCPVQAIRIER